MVSTNQYQNIAMIICISNKCLGLFTIFIFCEEIMRNFSIRYFVSLLNRRTKHTIFSQSIVGTKSGVDNGQETQLSSDKLFDKFVAAIINICKKQDSSPLPEYYA